MHFTYDEAINALATLVFGGVFLAQQSEQEFHPFKLDCNRAMTVALKEVRDKGLLPEEIAKHISFGQDLAKNLGSDQACEIQRSAIHFRYLSPRPGIRAHNPFTVRENAYRESKDMIQRYGLSEIDLEKLGGCFLSKYNEVADGLVAVG